MPSKSKRRSKITKGQCETVDSIIGPAEWRHYGFTFENSVGVCTLDTGNISALWFSPGSFVQDLSYAPTASDYSHDARLMTVNNWKNFGLSMRECTNLKAIHFPGCDLSGEELGAFFGDGMRGCPLEYLDLRKNSLGPIGINALLLLLESRQELSYLDLSETRMDDEAARKLSEGLNHCRIRDLNLEWNQIGDNGLESLLLSSNAEYLGTLEFRGNDMGQQGVETICRFLQMGNINLQSISLKIVRPEWVLLLLSAISKNSSLQFCHICGLAAGQARFDTQKEMKAALSKLVLNTSSFASFCESNHTFHFLSCFSPDESLNAVLRINSRRNMSNDEKLKRKFILLFSKDGYDLNELLTMKPVLVPYLIHILEKPDGCILRNRGNGINKIFRFISNWNSGHFG